MGSPVFCCSFQAWVWSVLIGVLFILLSEFCITAFENKSFLFNLWGCMSQVDCYFGQIGGFDSWNRKTIGKKFWKSFWYFMFENCYLVFGQILYENFRQDLAIFFTWIDSKIFALFSSTPYIYFFKIFIIYSFLIFIFWLKFSKKKFYNLYFKIHQIIIFWYY